MIDVNLTDARESEAASASLELARFVRPRVRVWEETVFVDRGEGLARDLQPTRTPVIALSFEYESFCVRASEPGARIFCDRNGAMQAFARDREEEDRARLALESFGAIELALLEDCAAAPDCDADYLVQPEGDAETQCGFVAHALPQLRALGWAVELADDYPYRIVDVSRWYAAIEPSEAKPDWFGLELGVLVDGHRIDLVPVLLTLIESGGKRVELRQIERHGPRYVPLPGGGYVELPAAHFERLARVLGELYQGDGADVCFPIVRAPALFELDESLREHAQFSGFEGRGGIALGTRVRALTRMHDDAIVLPITLHASLRPYQRDGLAFLQRLRACDTGGVLADDMGLGKTLQLIAHLCAEHARGPGSPSLVVAPTSLIGNWRRELARFAPGLRVSVLVGAARAAARAELTRADVGLVSYAVLLRDAELYAEQRFHCLVLDEAQAIKNARSRAAQLVKTLDSTQRICLSGTPIENNLHELWSLFDFAAPGLLGSEEQFRHFYRIPIEQQGDRERLATLRAQCAPYLLRRVKEEVARELPAKTEVVVPIELRGAQRELYESIRVAAHDKIRCALRKRGFSQSTVTILAALTKLRQLCCDPRLVQGREARAVTESAKCERLYALLDEQLARGRRALVFSQFASMLGLISQGLRERAIAHACLTGATADRERPIRAFQRGDAAVFLISLKAGGTGLNLTQADTVIHYDPWWNPAAQDQATDRAHRIGQDKPVFVYSLIAAGSVEERMLHLQGKKRRLAGAVIETNPEARSLFSPADVEHLLGPLEED